jgi:hypothetical protein
MDEMPFALHESEPQPGCPDGAPSKRVKDGNRWRDDLWCLQSGLGVDIAAIDAITTRYWNTIGYDPSRATGIGPPPYVPGASVDCLPVNSHRLLLFVLSGNEISAWTGQWPEKPDRSKSRVTWSDKPALRIVADLKERFTVYGTPARLFFLTESGKLYGCRDADKGGQRVKLLWQDDRQPIRAVIGDAASGNCFAFAPANLDSRAHSVYFEVGERIEPVAYDPLPLKKPSGDDPLKGLLGYARLLIADKKISR